MEIGRTTKEVEDMIRSAAQDAANAQMRREGRKAWTRKAYLLACRIFARYLRALGR